jgi:thioredoxin-like negative regulator of GroEL
VSGLAAQYQGKVAVKRINANEDPAAEKLNVQAVPTFIYLDSHGNVISRQVGFSEETLAAGFQNAVGK